jgi:hypothetical protein
VWGIRGTPCWHWATSSWSPCEFDARTDFIEHFEERGRRSLRRFLRSQDVQRSLRTHLESWDDDPAAFDAVANRVGYACHVARECEDCEPASDPLTLAYERDGDEEEVSTTVCDLYYTGFCFESPDVVGTACRMPPTIHPLYGTHTFQERLARLLGALADHEVRFRQENGGHGIDALYVGNMGTSGEWDQGRNAYPWHEHTLPEAARIFNDVMQTQVDSLQGAGWRLFTAVPSWTIDALEERLSLPADSPDAEVGQAYLAYSGLRLALERGVSIYHAAFGSWSPPGYVREAIQQYRDTQLVAGEPWTEPWRDDASQILTQMLASHASMVTFGTANPMGWRALGCLGRGRIPAGGLPEPYRHCEEGVDYGLQEWPALWQRGVLGMGYPLHLHGVAYPSAVGSGATFSVDHEWQDLGAEHPAGSFRVQFLLENERGGIVWKRLARGVELADLLSDEPRDAAAPEPAPVRFTSVFRMHESVAPDRTYRLKVAIVEDDGAMNGPNRGSIRLDMEPGMEDDALHYDLGDLRVVGAAGAEQE